MQSLKRGRHEKALASTPDRLLVLHGYMATPEDHWFAWLARQAMDLGMNVCVPQMPEPQRPSAHAWLEVMRDTIVSGSGDLYIVAHSLGAVTTLGALSGSEGAITVAGLILVSGFSRALPAIPELDDFCKNIAWDAERVVSAARQRSVFLSEDDPLVPPAFTQEIGYQLRAPVHRVHGAGHFLATDGFTRFDAVYEELVAMQSVNTSQRIAAGDTER